MRLKQLWHYVPLPQSLRLVWDRLTLSRLTTIYFVVALVHCFIQVILQVGALYINQDAAHILDHVAAVDSNSPTGYAVLTQSGPLRACTGIPGSIGSTACRMVWSGRVAPNAFGGYSPYERNDTENQSVTTSTATASSSIVPVSSSSVLASPSSQIHTVTGTSTIVTTTSVSAVRATTASSSSAVVTPRSSVSLSSTSTTLSTTTAPSSPSVSVSASTTTTVPPGRSPTITAGARGKRMYIPAHIPGSKTHTFARRDLTITPIFSQFNGAFQGVRLTGLSARNYNGPSQGAEDAGEAFVSSVCVHALQWPLQRLWNTQREDAAFIGFQFWVLGMSVVALLNESVPHVIAAFLTHLLVTGWSAFQIVQTANFRSEFNRLTTRGACGGVNLLPTYWRARSDAEIPVLALNVLVLLASAYMSWKLLKTFGWLTFKRVGASLEINRIYRGVLSLAIVLQLSLFFMVVSMALWINELYRGPAAGKTTLAPLYKAIVAIQLIALVPWLVMGWYAVRREMRKTMIVFIALSALFIVAWAGMFVSPTWRLTFLTWMFFRMVSVSAVILTVLSLGLGIFCLLGFGKGLPRYLNMNEDLESADFEPAQPPVYDPEKTEKIEFPSQNAYPTFSVAFPSRPSSASGHSHTRSGSSHTTHTHTRSGSNHTTHTRSESAHSRFGLAHSRSESQASVVPPRLVARPPTYQNFEVERPMSAATSHASVHDPFEHDLAHVMSTNAYPTMRSVMSNRSVDVVPGPGAGSAAGAGMGKRWIIE